MRSIVRFTVGVAFAGLIMAAPATSAPVSRTNGSKAESAVQLRKPVVAARLGKAQAAVPGHGATEAAASHASGQDSGAQTDPNG